MVVFARANGIMTRIDRLPGLGALLDNHFAWMAGIAVIAILPPMILLGMSFPVAARIVVSGSGNTGRDLGALYAGNTAGAILGAWAAGFFLIPSFGAQLSIEVLAAVNALLAVALCVASGRRGRLVASGALVLTLLSFVVAHQLAPDMYRRIVAGRFPGNDVMWVGEGQETSVALVKSRDNDVLSMYLNGQAQASDDGGMVWFHRLLGHLPMVLHNDPQDVLIVGIGGGTTAGALAQHNPTHLDIVELSDTVVQGAKYFSNVNHDVLNFPNLRLKIDDGRNHLLLTDRKYDLVTADSIHPRNAGASVLYSYEYYALVQKALKPGGLMAQWLEDRPDNPDNDAQRKLMTRTFLKAFPHATMWVYGALLVGSNEPIDTSLESIEARWDRRRLGERLAGSGIDSPRTAHGLFAMTEADLRVWAGEGPIMTDNNPYVEYFLSLPGGTGGPSDRLH
jgi:spermidine synthase